MKTIRTSAFTLASALTLAVSQALAQGPVPPTAPTLQEVLKHPTPNVVIFKPVRMGGDHKLQVTHIKAGDGSVKPGSKAGAMLVVYSSKPNEDGSHDVLFTDFHLFADQKSPVLNFAAFSPVAHAEEYIEQDGRAGIIAILIGLNQPGRSTTWKPSPLPPLDSISAGVDPSDPTAIGLLLPAVQKVRAAAARL